MLSSIHPKGFKGEVAKLKQRIVELSQREKPDSKQVEAIAGWLLSARAQIDAYVNIIGESLKAILNSGNQAQKQHIIFQKGDSAFNSQKTCIYLWQSINFAAIHLPNISLELLKSVSKLLISTVGNQVCFSPPTVKNALITIHNIIVKLFKGSQNGDVNMYTLEWMEAILVYHFQRRQNIDMKLAQLFKFSKSQQMLTQETEWIAYLFNQIFTNGIYKDRQVSFIELIQRKGNNNRIGYYVLHMVGNFFQDMIDKRVTTEMVSGFKCTIADVQQMYNSKGKCLVELRISKYDLAWICRRFNTIMLDYLILIKEYIRCQVQPNSNKSIEDLMSSWKTITDYLQQFCHVLNCVLFIGGYNNSLQDFVIELLLQSNKHLLEYLEFSYLLYRNIQSTKYQTKVTLMVEMEREAKRKLLTLAGIDEATIGKTQVKSLKLDRLLANGQLVSLLRLLSNLVHINHRAQIPFENDSKYLHMILSLTHDSVSQATMKQWAIMFIRNVSEWSQKLRDEISAIKVEMKVQ